MGLEHSLGSYGALGLSCPTAGNLLGPGMELISPALAGGFFTIEPLGKPGPWVFKLLPYQTYFYLSFGCLVDLICRLIHVLFG